MERYSIELVEAARATAVLRDIAPSTSHDLWTRIGAIARTVNRPGAMIRVTNTAGKIVILVGVATAIRLGADALGGFPALA